VAKPATTVANTTQLLVKTGRDPHEKRDTLRQLIRTCEGFKNAIIFCNRKREVALLHRSLIKHGFNAAALHGDLDQSARTAALDSFRKGEVALLIASDVAARGLDIPDVSHVFNFDVPHHADDYVHRIGRTGRAGRSGTAITVVAPSDSKAVAAIEHLIGQSIPWMGTPARAAEIAPSEARSTAPRSSEHHRSSEPRSSEQRSGEPRSNGRSKQERPPRRERTPAATPTPAAPVARLDDARPRRGQPRPAPVDDDIVGDHLPAFLLRPVRIKA
jgi:superfamily II DNA/RNA helicase